MCSLEVGNGDFLESLTRAPNWARARHRCLSIASRWQMEDHWKLAFRWGTWQNAERICGADQHSDILRINKAYLRISDYCSVMVTATVRIMVWVRDSIRVRVADCCIQTAEESDKMRISHMIKSDQRRSDLQIRSAFCRVPSHGCVYDLPVYIYTVYITKYY